MEISKLASILIIVIIFIPVFTGCNNITNTPLVMSPIIKTIYVNTLKELVTDKTITQTQSDKVLKEVKMDMLESKGCCSGLLVLVRDGVINQGQSDIINKRIQIVMKNNMQSR